MNLFAPNLSDGYKVTHGSQLSPLTTNTYSNFTPRNYEYARKTKGFFDDTVVFFGLQYAIKEYLINQWNDTFFNKPKKEVIDKFTRRMNNYLGQGKSEFSINEMAALHDLGYLPLLIKALPEGSKVNAGVPVFTIQNTHPDFPWITNYVETVLSATIWPMMNAASLSEQYYKVAKHFGNLTCASEDCWLPFSCHNFSMRGMRGVEDATITGAAHLLFHRGTDTLPSIDFLEDYYNADSDKELIGCSVNASEHATVTQMIALLGSEDAAFEHYITEVFPTGICAYVADSQDYWDVISRIVPNNKNKILARQPDFNGTPACVTLRPDSSPKTPLEIICGDINLRDYSNRDSFDEALDWMKVALVKEAEDAVDGECGVNLIDGIMLYAGKYYTVEVDIEWDATFDQYYIIDYDLKSYTEIIPTPEQKGTLQCLWDTFGGETFIGSNGMPYLSIDSHVKVIYGEAISLEMQNAIYTKMEEQGWSVSNVLFGIGSWSFLDRSSRDSYGCAMKGTNCIVDGKSIEMSKNPKTSSFKKSAKGLLRIEKEDDKFVLYDQQTSEQEKQGLLRVIFEDGKLYNETSLSEIRSLLNQ